MIVRCASCFRTERWVGPDREVIATGGARRTEGPHATWDTLRQVRAGTLGAVVAPCPACDRPMTVSEGTAPSPLMSWPLETLRARVDVPLEPAQPIQTPDGALDDSAFEQWLGSREPVNALHRDTLGGLSQITLLFVVAIIPILGWCWAATFLAVFFLFGIWGP